MAAGRSYNGWAANSDPSAIGVVGFHPLGITPFRNGGFAGGVKGGDVQKIFTDLVERLNEIEPIMRDPVTGQLGYGCWGYSYKQNVNNPSVLSCHASGTALDYNATKHRNGTSIGAGNSGWSVGNVVRVTALVLRYRGVVRWLSGNDPMHFEIKGTPAEVAAVAASLNRLEPGTPNPAPGTPATPAPAEPEEEDDMFSDEDRAQAQRIEELLASLAHGPGGVKGGGDLIEDDKGQNVQPYTKTAAMYQGVGQIIALLGAEQVTDKDTLDRVMNLTDQPGNLSAKLDEIKQILQSLGK